MSVVLRRRGCRRIRAAANAFITRLRPNDQLILVSFDGKVNILTEAVKVSELRKTKAASRRPERWHFAL